MSSYSKGLAEDLRKERDKNEQLRALLKECAEDLESWIEQAYPKNTLHYQGQKRRYERDMELPRRAYRLLGLEDDHK